MAKIVIIDYGMGNLRSVQKAFEAVGHQACITAEPQRVAEATNVVLPGVGAFGDAMARLRESGLADAVVQHIRQGSPFLGICLGYQLLFSRSQEGGDHEGLNVLDGEVVGFTPQPGLKIPHMGWNTLKIRKPACPLLHGLPPEPAYYFVHGYYPKVRETACVAAEADYPTPFAAMIWHANVFGTQFHPEKSQQLGLMMLKNFAEL